MELDERIVKELVVASVGKCVTCHQPFDTDSITVLGHQDNLWFLMLVCRECNSHGLVAAFLKDKATGVISELTPEELERLAETSPVTADDVLNVHEFLDGFNGDFRQLFGQSDDSDPS